MTTTARSSRSRPAKAPASSWRAAAVAPVDIAGLVFFRIALGIILLVEVLRFLTFGWVQYEFGGKVFHFTYYGFEWVRPLPGPLMPLLFFALGVLALMIALGARYRLAMGLFWLGFAYVFLLDKALYLNHFYLVVLLGLVMVFVPAHRRLSVDARRLRVASDYVPRWAYWLVQGQIAVPYVFGAIAKLNGDWLAGQPMQMWMSRMEHVRAVAPQFGEPWLAVLFSYGGFLIDLLVVPLLLWRKTRAVAFVVAVLFHLSNATMFEIGIFPWLMICGTTLFLDPSWPRKLFRLPPPKDAPAIHPDDAQPVGGKLAVGFLVVFFAVQLALPWRHWVYPGKVDWTEEGTRFAWRMMLNHKESAVQFLLVDPRSGQRQAIDIRPYLTPRQLNKMSYDPEMIREFAVFLGAQARAEGYADAEIHALVFCSLNGRMPQLLVDPRVDLSAVPRSLAHQEWIVPLTQPLPAKAFTLPPEQWAEHLDLEALARPQ